MTTANNAAPKDVRLLARLDVKAPNLIKGVNLEGVRKVGDPYEFATRYYEAGIDEIIYMDAVATLYDRNSLSDLVSRTARDVFVPMTVGGGLRTLENVDEMLRAGADKVAINTAAIRRPEIISEVAKRFGSQAMVLSVEAKRKGANPYWEAYTDNGRELTGRSVLEWVVEGVERGAGEVLVTAVDKEGMRRGFDVELMRVVSELVDVPVIASGGMGELAHFSDVVKTGGADAVAIAHVLHYEQVALADLRDYALSEDISVRVPR